VRNPKEEWIEIPNTHQPIVEQYVNFFLLIFVLVLLFMMSGCTDFYSGKRPIDYGRAKWISESPDIWFIVKDPEPGYSIPKGEMIVEDSVIYFSLFFSNGNDAFFSNGDQSLFRGFCKFSAEKLVVKIHKTKNLLDLKIHFGDFCLH